jgi:GTPase
MEEEKTEITTAEDSLRLDNSRLEWFSNKHYAHMPALLVGVYKGPGELQEALEYLKELELLCETHSIQVLEKLALSMRTFTAATFLSQGKLVELKDAVDRFGARLVVFDDEISPAQQRNLENFLRVPVIDRAEVILGVFADRARTKEAKLQIEHAQVKYIAPRLKRMWTHLSRQAGTGGGAGGGAYLKGEGEKQIEIDKRILKRRLDRLSEEIKAVKEYRKTQRGMRKRSEIPVFAIVGYTNAGKSTLMKKLTNADVFIEDKLFATLDTTTRKFTLPETHQDVLAIDTVGFIRKLPHLLVTAFRSTLEEAAYADILIHMIDASHHLALEQAKTTLAVLKELEAGDKPIITCFNKMDEVKSENCTPQQQEVYQKLRLTYPRAIELSVTEGVGIDALLHEMEHVLKEGRVRLSLSIPQSEYHMVTEAMRQGKILSQEYDENNVLLQVDLPRLTAFRFEKYKLTQS